MTIYAKGLVAAAGLALGVLGATSAGAVSYTVQDPGDGVVLLSASTSTNFAGTIVGSNDDTDLLETGFTVTAGAGEILNVSGSFSYSTFDTDGSFWDPLLLIENGTETDLAPNLAFLGSASGLFSFTVLAGQSFSFVIRSLDGEEGVALANIVGSIQLALVPLPATALMLLAGLGGLAALRRRQTIPGA
jgi:hypothetical protein